MTDPVSEGKYDNSSGNKEQEYNTNQSHILQTAKYTVNTLL